jgi:acyl-CoA thioester hydrolase
MEYQGLSTRFICEIPTRWADQDIYHHINNVSYFRYFEEARVRWFEQLGLPIAVEGNDASGPVIVHTSATYLKPILYPAVILVRCYVGEPGRSSFPMYHTLSTTTDPDTVYTEGFVKTVWINHASGKSVPLPEKLLGNLGLSAGKTSS